MSVDDLVKELRSAKTFDIVDARAKVEIAFDAATSFEERGQVLAVFKAIMDEGERQLISTQGNQSQLLAAFRTARAQDYKLFIVKECTVGLHSPGGGDISIEMLMAVTNREIAAGRMSEDHSQRKIAVEGAAVPHFSHAKLIAQHAKLQEATARSSGDSEHMTVRAKLKKLFRLRDHGTASRKS